MEFAKRMWSQIGAHMHGMSVNTIALIGMSAALLVVVMFMLLMYVGAKEMVPVAFAGPNASEVVAELQSAGIDAKRDGTDIVVSTDDQYAAYRVLQMGGLLGEDPSAAFDRMFESQSAWETDKRDQQRNVVARSRYLSRVIETFDSVKSASVVYDEGKDGIGSRHVRASASATITATNGPVTSDLADAVASLISGAVARVSVTDVQIIDARSGRRVAVSDPDNMLPSDALEVKRSIEERKRRQIEEILDYIPDVRVGVNVLMDSVASRQEHIREYEKDQLLESQRTEESSRKNIANAGEPGPRSNTGLSINGSGGAGTEETENTTETRFVKDKPVLREQSMVHVGNQVKQINVAVNVPRSYFVGLYKQDNPDAEGEPDTAALAQYISVQIPKIEEKVQVMTLADVQGTVKADMVPDPPTVMTAGAGTTIGKFFDGGMGSTVGLGALALVSLALMLGMVRKATKPETLPSIEELAGVPPSLPSDEELIGEAEESEATMTGVELDEDDLKARRIAEQIGDLVRADPNEASRLLGKWVSTDE